ncbi:hypothetical protein FQV21_0014479, partial [Spheniscus demersus]
SDPRDYKCHVENASEISGSIRSLNIFLQAPGIAATKGKLSRIQKVITLECFSLQSPVQVHLLYLEKMHGDLTNQTVEKRTLQSLKVVTSADRKPPISHTCVLLTRHRKKFQRKFILREKEGIPSINDKDMLNRQKLSIVIKVFIACILLAFALPCIVFVIYEIPCLCLCPDWINSIWSSRRSLSAACVPVHDQTATLLTPFLKGTEQKPLKAFV